MIYRLAYRRYCLPFSAPVRTAHGLWAEREGVVVRLESESGGVGWGEAAPVPGFGDETVDQVEAACRGLGERVGEEAMTLGPLCLRGALAAAMADLPQFGDQTVGHLGEVAGQVIRRRGAPPRQADLAYSRTGGPPVPTSSEFTSTRASLPVAGLLPAGRDALAAANRLAEAGFRTFKWKVGVGDLADELGLLDDLCGALPSGARLRLDANGAWDRRRAQRWLERCAERPVEFVEQPAPRGADDLLCGLATDYPTPLALDESLVGEGDIAFWLDAGWPGVFVIKPSLLGDAAGILTRLAGAGGEVVFSSALETAVGARSALRTALGWSGPPRALGFGVWPIFADPRFDGPAAAPFLRREDIDRIDPEALWRALP